MICKRLLTASLSLVFGICAALVPALAQAPPFPAEKDAPAKRVAIRAGHLIDGKDAKVLDNVLILIDGDNITSVTAGGTAPSGVETIDLSKSTVLPGFIDLHT